MFQAGQSKFLSLLEAYKEKLPGETAVAEVEDAAEATPTPETEATEPEAEEVAQAEVAEAETPEPGNDTTEDTPEAEAADDDAKE
jgi:hypothetical protein